MLPFLPVTLYISASKVWLVYRRVVPHRLRPHLFIFFCMALLLLKENILQTKVWKHSQMAFGPWSFSVMYGQMVCECGQQNLQKKLTWFMTEMKFKDFDEVIGNRMLHDTCTCHRASMISDQHACPMGHHA